MTRSIWKGPFVHPSLLKKIDKLKDQPNKKPIKTWSRNSTIIPDFVGHSFMIHNGKSFIPITISEEMVGHKLGEFAPTRTFKGHTPADKKAADEISKRVKKATGIDSKSFQIGTFHALANRIIRKDLAKVTPVEPEYDIWARDYERQTKVKELVNIALKKGYYGGKIVSNVSKKLDYLIAGEKPTS